jgi:hypothetical protein
MAVATHAARALERGTVRHRNDDDARRESFRGEIVVDEFVELAAALAGARDHVDVGRRAARELRIRARGKIWDVPYLGSTLGLGRHAFVS